MRAALLAVISLLALALAPARAADDAPRWLKGNLHTHSLWSDGNDFPEMIADWYAKQGYHFLALSDHNVMLEGERWMNLRDIAKRGGAEALDKYVARFGKEWVELRGDGAKREVRLRTLAEFRGKSEQPGKFLLIPGEEITDKLGSKPVHLNATNLRDLIKPQGGATIAEVIERNVLAAEEQERRTGQPVLVHLNHPNYKYGVSAEELASVLRERFVEVHNGHPGVHTLGDEAHPGVELLWDIANALRIGKLKAPPLFGLGTDDSHDYHGPPVDPRAMSRSSQGRGWVMVRAARLSPEAVIDAMRRGDFHASSGVVLRDVVFHEGVLSLEIEPDGDAEFTTRFVGTPVDADLAGKPYEKDGKPVDGTLRYAAAVGQVFAEVKGLRPTHKLTGREMYVRAVVSSSKPPANPSYKDQVKQAWTQPVGWEGRAPGAKQGNGEPRP